MIHEKTQRPLQERKSNFVYLNPVMATIEFERSLVNVENVLVGDWNALISARAKQPSEPPAHRPAYTEWSQRNKQGVFKEKPVRAGAFYFSLQPAWENKK